MSRTWRVTELSSVDPALVEAVAGHPLVAQLLQARGIRDPRAASAFLDPDRYVPSPPSIDGTDAAVAAISDAVASGGRIRIWGDLDADGQTATAVLVEAMRHIGAAVDYQLPKRGEGHGLHPRVIDEALRDGVSLLITCDTGIAALDQVSRARRAGLGVVITDHHDLPEVLPPADAIVNPKTLPEEHPLYHLAGVGVAYQVARALISSSRNDLALDGMLDLVAIGLVADRVRQVADVRYLIQTGLVALRDTQRPGLQAMMELADMESPHADEADVLYRLAPRMEAGGRFASPDLVVRLLLTSDREEAQSIAQRLEALNRDRRGRTQALLAQVEDRVRRDPDSLHAPALVLDGDAWEPGVLGVVASRLVERHMRPVVLIAHRQGKPSVASGRSVPGIDINAAIGSQSSRLLEHGGHPMAAGFSLEREHVPAVRQGILAWIGQHGPLEFDAEQLVVDAEIGWDEVGLPLAREFGRLAPFGSGNPNPVVASGSLVLVRSESMGQHDDSPHVRLHLSQGGSRPVPVAWYGAGQLPQVGEPIDVAFHLRSRHWHGRERLEVELVDWRPADPPGRQAERARVGGRLVIDRRGEADGQKIAQELRAELGEDLVIWVEGTTTDLAGTASRSEMHGPSPALAMLTPPPGPCALRWVLDRLAPQSVYVLPGLPMPETTLRAFVAQVAGMVRVALRSDDGVLDILRMCARLGAREEAVRAALRLLESSGGIRLCEDEGHFVATSTQMRESGNKGQPRPAKLTNALQTVSDSDAQEAARASLAYLLRETHAYRRAYPDLGVDELLGGASHDVL